LCETERFNYNLSFFFFLMAFWNKKMIRKSLLALFVLFIIFSFCVSATTLTDYYLSVDGDITGFGLISNVTSCTNGIMSNDDGLLVCADAPPTNSYNATYDTWSYNQTTPATDYADVNFLRVGENSTDWVNWFNVLFVNDTVLNLTYLQVPYDSNLAWVNQTNNFTGVVEAYGVFVNGSSVLTGESDPLFVGENVSLWGEALNKYNSSYDLWAYNQTTPAITYADNAFLKVGENLTSGFTSWDSNLAWLNDTVFNTTYLLVGENVSYIFTPDNVVFMNESLLNDTYVRVGLGDSYNATYDTWAYNQTTPAIDYYINNPNSYNASYELYAYNQTQPFTDWLSSFVYNYNQTTPAIDWVTAQSYLTESVADLLYADIQWNYNMTAPAIAYVDAKGYLTGIDWTNVAFLNDTVFNNTYAAITWSYNMTTPAIDYFVANPNSYNSTYDTWSYNQTTPAISYADSIAFNPLNIAFINDSVFNNTYLQGVDWTNVLFFNESLLNSTYLLVGENLSSGGFSPLNVVFDNESLLNSTYVRLDDVNNSYMRLDDSNLNVSFLLKGENETGGSVGWDNVVFSNETFLNDTYLLSVSECYQESANVSNGCGGKDSGIYFDINFVDPIDWLDEDWTTASGGTGTRYGYVNYTKPTGALSTSLWQVKGNGGAVNITIPQDCWDSDATTLTFRVSTVAVGPNAYWDCYNGTWVNVRGAGEDTAIYEEAMIWKISNSYANIQWAYNQTTPAEAYADSLLGDDWTNVAFLNDTVFNNTYLTGIDWTNVAWLNDSIFNNTYLTGVDWTNVAFLNDSVFNDTYSPLFLWTDVAFMNDSWANSTYVRLDDINNSYSSGTVLWDNVVFMNETLLNTTYVGIADNLLNSTYVRLDDINNSYSGGTTDWTNVAFLNDSVFNTTYLLVGENLTSGFTSWDSNLAWLNDTVFNNTYSPLFLWTDVAFLNDTIWNNTYVEKANSLLNSTYVRLDDINNSYVMNDSTVNFTRTDFGGGGYIWDNTTTLIIGRS